MEYMSAEEKAQLDKIRAKRRKALTEIGPRHEVLDQDGQVISLVYTEEQEAKYKELMGEE